MSQPVPEDPDTPESAGGAAAGWVQLETLWHYRPDYDYRPDLFEYAEFHTTDPDYVMLDVQGYPFDHSQYLGQIQNALDTCIAYFFNPPARPLALRRVDIAGIPEHMFASRRLTSVLIPDMAVWACAPSTPPPHDIYWFDRDGVPWLVLEVVTPSTTQARAVDMDQRRIAYAHMGVREFWMLDTRQDIPLIGYTLDARDGSDDPLQEYRQLEVGSGGGQHSGVLRTALRWVSETLECWHVEEQRWVSSAGTSRTWRTRPAGARSD